MNVVCRFKRVVVRHHFKLERHELDDLMSPIEPETIIQLRRNEWWCTVEYKNQIQDTLARKPKSDKKSFTHKSVMVTTGAHLTFFIYSGAKSIPHLLISQ